MFKHLLTFIVLLVFTVHGSFAADSTGVIDKVKFEHYMQLPQKELAQEAMRVLKVKYPDEDWSSWNFPEYVFTDMITETSYKIAAREPRLLGRANISDSGKVIPCYCTCDNFGHENLLYCFFREGDPDKGFDDHGSMCSICMRQAFLAILWDDLGASHDQIMAGMEKQFAPIVEKYKQRNQ